MRSRAAVQPSLKDEIEILRAEVEALRRANQTQERQILGATEAMDRMLVESEEQRGALRRANAELGALNAYVARVTDSMDDVLILVGTDGRVREANRCFRAQLGWEPGDLAGRNLDDLVAPEDLKRLSDALPELPWQIRSVLYELVLQDEHLSAELRFRPRDAEAGEALHLVRGAVLRGPQGKEEGVVLVGSDIGAIKAREEALVAARHRAVEATRAKSEFLANMSHELRTPLNAIIGFADVIGAETFGPPGHERYLEYANHIGDAGRHLLSIINDILDLSKVEAGQMTLHKSPQGVGQAIQAVLELLHHRAEDARIALEVELEPDLPPVHADGLRLKQIMVNLISNAIKFTPADGGITLSARRDGGWLLLEVTDTGIGIAPEDIPRVLAPFGQAEDTQRRRFEGTGLGLPLAKHLAELHGGALEIDSRVGRGTSVRVHLPFVPRD